MLRQVDLHTYLPEFMQEYREMQRILAAQTPEIQMLFDETEIIKHNQFILTCDEIGIKRFESLLGIVPNPKDPLQVRIFRVLTRWNDAIPYTCRGLIEKLDILCGKGNYTLHPNFNQYELELIVRLSLRSQVEELEYMLSYMIPANIKMIVRNQMEHVLQATVYLAGITVERSHFQIMSKINKERMLTSAITSGTAIATVLERTIC